VVLDVLEHVDADDCSNRLLESLAAIALLALQIRSEILGLPSSATRARDTRSGFGSIQTKAVAISAAAAGGARAAAASTRSSRCTRIRSNTCACTCFARSSFRGFGGYCAELGESGVDVHL